VRNEYVFTGGDDVMAIHFMSLKRCEDNDRRYDDDDVSILTVNVNCKSVCMFSVDQNGQTCEKKVYNGHSRTLSRGERSLLIRHMTRFQPTVNTVTVVVADE
jgi:hypothetical protein